MTTSHIWTFRARLRRGAFGWNGSRTAIGRIDEALAEVLKVARTDPALAGEGAVLLLEKASPALCNVDSSSGALGSAMSSAVASLVPIIAAAPVTEKVRHKWLERLFDAYQEDDPPYIESLADHWGTLCAEPHLASRWADELLPLVRRVMAERRRGVYAYTKSSTPCYSALYKAGRCDELLEVLALEPKPWWHDQQWVARVLAARGDIDGAVQTLERARAISAMAEGLLLSAGRIEEAFQRYAIEAGRANTHIGTYRNITRKYPGIEPRRILGELIASMPGEEGKWFATAKTLKQYELAVALAWRSPVEPKTLIRAARDHVEGQPAFALEAALAALHWMAEGWGYELTGTEPREAQAHALAAADVLERRPAVEARIAEMVAGDAAQRRWVRQCLGLERSSAAR
jgi:tetratricopeptide (TPR) repeat protein